MTFNRVTFVFVRVFFVSPCSMLHQITYDRAWGMVVEIENPAGRNLEERIIRDFSIIFLSRFYHKYTYKKQSNQSNSETNGGVKWLKKLNPHVPGQCWVLDTRSSVWKSPQLATAPWRRVISAVPFPQGQSLRYPCDCWEWGAWPLSSWAKGVEIGGEWC